MLLSLRYNPGFPRVGDACQRDQQAPLGRRMGAVIGDWSPSGNPPERWYDGNWFVLRPPMLALVG